MDMDSICKENEGESKSLYRKNLMLIFLGAAVLLYILLPNVFTSDKTYVNVVTIINLIFKLCMFMSAVIAYKISHKTVFMYLEIIFGVISIINIVFLIIIIKNGTGINNINNVCYILKLMSNVIVYTSAIIFSKVLNSAITDKLLKKVQIIYGIIPLISIIVIEANEKYFNSIGTIKLANIICFSELVFIALLFEGLVIVYKNLNKLQNKGVLKSIIAADVMFIISHIISLQFIPLFRYLHSYSNVFTLVANAIVCAIVIKCTLKSEIDKLQGLIDEKNRQISAFHNMSKQVFQSISDGVIIRNDNDIVFANNSMIEMTKAASSEKFEGFDVIKLIGNNYIKKFKEYNKLVCGGEKIGKIKEEIVCFDGNRVMVEVSCTKVNMGGKNVILSIIKNLSKQMKAEENERKLIEARNKDKLRGEFFANISHELRTPINVIYSSLQVMQMHIEKENIKNEKIDCYMKVIKQNCYRLLRIISNLIDITKIEAGFLKPSISKREIVSLVENISMSIVPYLHEKNMELIFDTDVEEKYAYCDPDMMERVMLNLFSNAVKFRKNNGHVWVNMHDTGDGNITIEVKDDGIGIAEEKQHLIFKRFTQVDSSLIRRSKGSGIGLSLVKSIVEMNSGTISFKSKENVGTKFIIKLPSDGNAVVDGYSNVRSICDSSIESTKEKVNIEFAGICN